MEAAWVSKHGNVLDSGVLSVRKDVLRPEPGENEVQVAVRCAALNPVDFKIIEGFLKQFHSAHFPYVPGADFAGVVSKVGSGCSRWHVGDEVIGKAGDHGALAQFVCVREDQITGRPKNLSWEESAGLPLAGMTALEAVNECAVPRGGTLLVLGGSSSVGSMAIQIAKSRGVRVVATCGEHNVEYVRSIGADRVIDRKREAWHIVLHPKGSRVDSVFDAVGEPNAYKNSRDVLENLRYGKFVTIAEGATEKLSVTKLAKLSAKMAFRKARGRPSFTWLILDEKRNIDGLKPLEKVRELAEAGTLRPHVDRALPLDSVVDAFARIRTGHAAGKVVVLVPQKPEAEAAPSASIVDVPGEIGAEAAPSEAAAI